MEKLTHYREILSELLAQFVAERKSRTGDVENQLLIDPKNDHYQVMRVGWKDRDRVYYPIFHFDIRNGKIWVQHNATDYDIVADLEARGIPKDDIVLAFHSPYMRQFTGYAVA
jgi:XisI protein